MTIKGIILECLIQDDEAFTQIVEYFELDNEIQASPSEIKKTLSEMVEQGYIRINYKWKTEKDEYPFSLTDKGRSTWQNIEMILECLIQGDKSFTQIIEYFELDNEVQASPSEIKETLLEMVEGGYIHIDYKRKTEKNEYPFSLTDKGRSTWESFQ